MQVVPAGGVSGSWSDVCIGARGQGSGAQGPGLRAQGPGLRGQGSGLRGQGSGARAQGSGAQGPGLRAQGPGLRAQGPGLRGQGSGARAQGSGARAQGSGARAQGPGLRAQGPGFRGQGSGLIVQPEQPCIIHCSLAYGTLHGVGDMAYCSSQSIPPDGGLTYAMGLIVGGQTYNNNNKRPLTPKSMPAWTNICYGFNCLCGPQIQTCAVGLIVYTVLKYKQSSSPTSVPSASPQPSGPSTLNPLCHNPTTLNPQCRQHPLNPLGPQPSTLNPQHSHNEGQGEGGTVPVQSRARAVARAALFLSKYYFCDCRQSDL